jgi:hypothetical protein
MYLENSNKVINKECKEMPVNQMETNLQAITTTIAFLEKDDSCDPELLAKLREERDRILRELNVHRH